MLHDQEEEDNDQLKELVEDEEEEEEDNYSGGQGDDEEEEEEGEEVEDHYTSDEGDDKETTTPVISLDELPSSAKLETMRLFLGCARVRFPSTSVIFTSLTDLALQWLKITADSGDLGRLLSSECCPRRPVPANSRGPCETMDWALVA